MLFRSAQLDRIERLLTDIHKHIKRMETTNMTTAAEIKSKVDALLTKVQANTDATASVALYVQGLKDQLTAVQLQLAEAIASNDPGSLQAASDALDAAISSIDSDTAAEAALVNTPAAPDA